MWPDSEPTKLLCRPKQNLGGEEASDRSDKQLPPSNFTGQFLRKTCKTFRVWCLYRYLFHVPKSRTETDQVEGRTFHLKELLDVLLSHHLPVLGELGQVLHQVLLHAVVHGDGLHLQKSSTANNAVLRIRHVYPGSRILILPISEPGSRISDPKTATKETGETKFFVIPFYWATNFTKLNIILVLKCWRYKFGSIFKELYNFLPKKLSLSSQTYGFVIQGSKRHRVPDPDPQHCYNV